MLWDGYKDIDKDGFCSAGGKRIEIKQISGSPNSNNYVENIFPENIEIKSVRVEHKSEY